MARDLFEEAGIESRDLFEESGMGVGISGIAKDIGGSVGKTAKAVYNIARHPFESYDKFSEALGNLWNESKAAGKQVRENPERAFQNMMGGFGTGAEKLYDVPANIADYFASRLKPEWQGEFPRGKEILGKFQDLAGVRRPESMYLPELQEGQPLQEGDAALRAFSESWPSLATGRLGAGSGLQALMENRDPLEAVMKAKLLQKVIEKAPEIYRGGKKLGKEIYEGAKYTGKESNLAEKARNMQAGNYNPELVPVIKEAQNLKVPLYPQDLFPKSGFLKNLTEIAEKTPLINIQAQRAAQNEAGYMAMKGLLEQQSNVLKHTPFEGIKNIEKVAQGDSFRAPAAQRLLKEIQTADSDLNQIIKTSGNVSLFNKKLKADEMLDNVSKLATPLGKVPATNSIAAVDKAIEMASSQPVPNKKVINQLKSIKKALSKKRNDEQPLTQGYNSGLGGMGEEAMLAQYSPYTQGNYAQGSRGAGNAPLTELNAPINEENAIAEIQNNPHDFNGMRSTRSSLNSMINDYYSGSNALIGEAGVGYLQSVVNGITDDMEHFATSHSPELKNAYLAYNKYYKDNIVPYKDKQIAKAFKDADPDKIYATFIKKSTEGGQTYEGSAERFYNALDQKGKIAVRAKFLENTLRNSYDAEKQIFSPAKFATALKKNQAVKKFYTPEERVRLENVQKLMRSIEKSGQMTEPQNGAIMLKYVLGTAALGTLGLPSYLLKKTMSSEDLARFMAAKGK